MIPLPATPIQLAEGVTFAFPDGPFCNCGTSHNLTVIVQDTRLTRYMFGGGSEYTFRLPLPFCTACAPSAQPRPVPLLHRGLFLTLVFAVFLLSFTIAGIGLEWQWLLEHATLLAAAFAIPLVIAWYGRRRPTSAQTNYYQPVRILKLRQQFLSGRVLGIRFGMSNLAFAQQFRSLNLEVITKGLIEVVS